MSEVIRSYSEDVLLRNLRDWWDNEAGIGEDDPFAVTKPRAGTIFEVIPAIDSLAMVAGLLTIEIYVGFEISPSIIRRGGYQNFEDMVTDLLPKVRKLVVKRKEEVA